MTDEYIRKQDAVDAMGKAQWAKDRLLDIEPANVAPVVRCKDCTWYLDLRHWCKCHDTTMFENDFCSYGERKE